MRLSKHGSKGQLEKESKDQEGTHGEGNGPGATVNLACEVLASAVEDASGPAYSECPERQFQGLGACHFAVATEPVQNQDLPVESKQFNKAHPFIDKRSNLQRC